jgi:hypothetical protein
MNKQKKLNNFKINSLYVLLAIILFLVVPYIYSQAQSDGYISGDEQVTSRTVWTSHSGCSDTGVTCYNGDCSGHWRGWSCDTGSGVWCTNHPQGMAGHLVYSYQSYSCTYVSEVTEWSECQIDPDNPTQGIQYAVEAEYDTVNSSSCESVPVTQSCILDLCTNIDEEQRTMPAGLARNSAGECHPEIDVSCVIEPRPTYIDDVFTATAGASQEGYDDFEYTWQVSGDVEDLHSSDNVYQTSYSEDGSKEFTVEVHSPDTDIYAEEDCGLYVVDPYYSGVCGSFDPGPLCVVGTADGDAVYDSGVDVSGGWSWTCMGWSSEETSDDTYCEQAYGGGFDIVNEKIDPRIVQDDEQCNISWEVLGSSNYSCNVSGENVGMSDNIDVNPGGPYTVSCTDIDTAEVVDSDKDFLCIKNPVIIEQ